jgi:hypothetical protein
MFDGVAGDCLANVGGCPLAGKLGGVNANDHQLMRVPFPESTQLRDIVVAVNSTEGKELQQHNLAAQAGHCQRRAGIDPIQRRGKFRRIHFAAIAALLLAHGGSFTVTGSTGNIHA